MNLKFLWKIGDEMSEWHTRSFVYADKMDLGNTAQGMRGKLFAHDVLLKDDFGVKPIVVDEGQWIHILLKSPQDTERSYIHYGYSGDPNERKKVEG